MGSKTYCFLDIDINDTRRKLRTAAAFVDATDSRYGFSSKNLRYLGGSEISRLKDTIQNDHEWKCKDKEVGGIETKPPSSGQRLIVKLFWDIAPLACENFATLCSNGSVTTGKKNCPIGDSGKPLTYRESEIHRVVPGFVMQGGDFVLGNGSGGESIFGKRTFKDERAGLALKLDKRGLLAMGNSGKNSNSSQFFLTFESAPQCNGKHVVFGTLVSGHTILDEVEKFGDVSGKPSVSIKITDCGIYNPFESSGAGYWYDQPNPDSYSGFSSLFITRPRVGCLAPSTAVLQKFHSALGTFCHVVVEIEVDKAEKKAQAKQISEFLEEFRLDCVLIAPACQFIKSSIVLPENWREKNIDNDEVILVAKPIEAKESIHLKSWMTNRNFYLDGKF